MFIFASSNKFSAWKEKLIIEYTVTFRNWYFMPKLTAYLLYKHIATLFEADKIVIRINLLCVLGVYGQIDGGKFFHHNLVHSIKKTQATIYCLKANIHYAFFN